MNVRQLIMDCLDRHENPLDSRKSIMHAVQGDFTHPYHPQVFYAHERSIMATEMEAAGIGILPIIKTGNAARGNEYSLLGWETLLTMHHWEMEYWRQSYGFQVYTGKPSGYLTDLDFEVASVLEHPYETMACMERLCALTDNPLVVISKSGGIRFSCRTPGYVHPRSVDYREYVVRFNPRQLDEYGNPIRESLYLEIFGDKSLSRYDSRYEIVEGDLLNPPVIDYQLLLDAVKPFKDEVHVDPPPRQRRKRTPKQNNPKGVAKSQVQVKGKYTLSNLPKDLEWKRVDPNDPKAGLKSKRTDYRCTMTKHRKSQGSVQFYKKPNGVVSIFCHNCKKPATIGRYHEGERERIAELIANAPPYEEVPSKDEQRKSLIKRIRKGVANHTELRRPPPILHKSDEIDDFSTLELNDKEIIEAFEKLQKLILLNSETGSGKNFQFEEWVRKGGKAIKTAPTTPLAVADVERLREKGINAFHWRARHYLWDLQEERTYEQRLLDPFGNGAVCIDAIRCNKLFEKGGHARKSICPYCDVYEKCQTEGYLSQEETAAISDVVVIAMQDLFFNPVLSGFASRLIKFKEIGEEDEDGELEWEETDRIGVLDEGKAHTFYLQCMLAKSQLQSWRDMWSGTELGNFSLKLLELLEVETGGFDIRKLREYIVSISGEDCLTISEQMQKMRAEGHFVKLDRPLADKDTGDVLSVAAMKFKPDDVLVYIAKDEYAYETLWTEKEIPCLPPKAYKPVDMVEMSLEESLKFEIHTLDTEDDIDKLPFFAGERTPLIQLQDTFEYYGLDDNTPMRYSKNLLEWYLPPELLSGLQRLVVMGASLNIEHAKRTFRLKDKDIAAVFTKPTPYQDGNNVFQIRTGAYPRGSLMEPEKDENGKWQWVGIKEAGEKFLNYIQSCVEEDTSQHAVITFKKIVEWQADYWMEKYGINEKEEIYGSVTQNLRFFGHFGKMEGLSRVFDQVNDLWILGLPEVDESVLKQNTKLIYGSDDKVLVWDRSDTREFVDVRVQSVYESMVLAMVEQAVGRARLNRFQNKRVYLFTGVRIKSITDRRETLLFDFADCEIATSLSQLKEVILKRQREEEAEIDKEDAVKAMLLAGETGYNIIQQGIAPSHIVNRLVQELRSELNELRKQQDKELTRIAKALSSQGKSINEIATQLGKSRGWVRPRVRS